MIKFPKIAVFEPEDSEREALLRLFQRPDYLLRTAEIPADLIREQEQDRFDCVIMPMRLKSGTTGLTTCLQLKSIELLASIPIVALAPAKDPAILEALYGAGADVVMFPPFDANLIFLQVGALARQKRSFDELLRSNVDASGLRLSTIAAFNSVREGVLIFDTKMELIFANQSACRMMGWHEDAYDQNDNQFLGLLQEFSAASPPRRNPENRYKISSQERRVNRADGGQFRAVTRISELEGSSGASGYAISISDLSEIDQLGNMLIQADKVRNLSLFCAALCRNLLGNNPLGTPTSPLQKLEGIVDGEDCSAPVAATIMGLLELLDLVINPNLAVKTKLNETQMVAVRPSHLWQLAGHLLLHAVDFAGPGGEVNLGTENSEDGALLLSISADSRRVTPYVPNDQLSRLLQGDLTMNSQGSDEENLPFALLSAQNIADLYKSDVQIKSSSENSMRLRVKLPVQKG